MAEPMATYTEVWPVAADDPTTTDDPRLWLISGRDALRDRLPVMSDSPDAFAESRELLRQFGVHADPEQGEVPVLHGTSGRRDGQLRIDTFIAVVACPGLVLVRWRDACTIGRRLLAALPQPATHAANRPPEVIRHSDVFKHALRHLVFLRLYDAEAAAKVPPAVWPHLTGLAPALAGMHQERHRPAA